MIDDEELARRAVAALRAEALSGTENGFQSPVITEPAEASKDERRKVRAQ